MYVLALAPTNPPPSSLLPFTLAIFHVNSVLGENTCCHLSLRNVHLALLCGEHKGFSLMQTSPSLVPLLEGVLRRGPPAHPHADLLQCPLFQRNHQTSTLEHNPSLTLEEVFQQLQTTAHQPNRPTGPGRPSCINLKVLVGL